MLFTPAPLLLVSPETSKAYDIALWLGLGGGTFQMCLDAGDAASYSGTGQSWSDRATDMHFQRGTSSGGDAADPTFNGSAGGLSSSEYWSFDGGDYFMRGNSTWMQNLHKDNALFTLMAWLYRVEAAAYSILGNMSGDAGGNIGCRWGPGGTGAVSFFQRNGSAQQTVYASTATAPHAAWTFAALSMNEAGGAGASFMQIDDAVETFNGAYTSPTASNASFDMNIGARGNGSSPLASGSRMAMVLAWTTALSQAQVESFHALTRGRFGV